ncbi:MAG: hypothetical protein U0169_21660 [Polyangiaceae bacterium]
MKSLRTQVLFVAFIVVAATSTTGCLGFGLGCGPLRALIGAC